ncbi:hypothetical protein JXR93_06875 [bacterium]|nr:hypothetical protein [bacterium]
MKKLLIAMILLVNISIFAAEEKSKFYDFSDLMINGDFKKPEMLSIKDKKATKFDKMLNLKASFIPQIEKSDKDIAVK